MTDARNERTKMSNTRHSIAQTKSLTSCGVVKSVTGKDTLDTARGKLSGIKTASLVTIKPYRVAIRAVSILSREGLGMRESEVFLNADFKTARQIADVAGQLLPNVRSHLFILSKKGVLDHTQDAIPRWHWTDKGTQIMQEINECAI